MLTRLHLEQFKCFEKQSLPLAPLTLLTGLNAAGKSSVIQSLALLSQTIRENEWADRILLNGTSVKMGTASDVINKVTGRKGFGIGIETEHLRCDWKAESADRTALVMPISEVKINDISYVFDTDTKPQLRGTMRWLIPPDPRNDHLISQAQSATSLIRCLTYIGAERLGPREVYEAFSEDEERTVGVQGERTAHYLYKNSIKLTREQLVLPTAAPQLPRQTAAWLADFFPGAEFEIEPVAGANLVLLRIRSHPSTDYHRPQNVGYGLTHILPILAACLGADEGQIIMIDNPEAHLHPSGQAKMGKFLAGVAASGVQLIVETHSDHVLNGIRRAVRDGLVKSDKTAVHFFSPEVTKDASKPVVVSPSINAQGQVDQWPVGFFDQFDNDMMALIDWKK
jgi:predicted ATPase